MVINNTQIKYKVSASVNPTNRIIAKRARDSSGRVPLYYYQGLMNFINLSFNDFIRNLGGLKYE